MHTVVTAVYDVPVGEVWSRESIAALKKRIESAGLRFEVVEEYRSMSEEALWNNLKYFLDRIIPVSVECGVNMAIHEDDPCWSIFGLPRIITDERNPDRFLRLADVPNNGITLCTGSLGCSGHNDVVKMAAKHAEPWTCTPS